ncbi:MAG: hypothetical protein JKY95_03105 [Planctomycetaceae bacterium]|nr:hypothetical protein [Planctomycetaceae bacterium]
MEQEPSLSPKKGIQTATGFTLVCLGLLVCVIAVTFIASSVVGPPDESPFKHVGTFTGKDQGTVGPFTVNQHWEFRWTHNGHIEQIIWTRKDGHQGMLMEMQRKPIREHGSLNYGEGGEYTMEVIGKGDWEIEIYQF